MGTTQRNLADTKFRDGLALLPRRVSCKITLEETGCWLWHGAKSNNGYGTLKIGSRRDCSRKTVLIHRFIFGTLVAPIPKNRELDHSCEVRLCVNPEHLRTVTHRFNVLRGETVSAKNSRKTHCPRGHPYDVVNNRGWRRCSICHAFEERQRWIRRSNTS
jgi:HNH endonuclease